RSCPAFAARAARGTAGDRSGGGRVIRKPACRTLPEAPACQPRCSPRPPPPSRPSDRSSSVLTGSAGPLPRRLRGEGAQLREEAGRIHGDRGLLVMHPDRASASRLATLAEHGGKHGFVVADMVDADDFAPIEPVALPAGPVYVTVDLDRGDHMANWSPDEA